MAHCKSILRHPQSYVASWPKRLGRIAVQVEADIRPFRSLLLGLFFTTTGSSMDLQLLYQQWPIVIALLGGLLAVKIGIIGTISQWFGLSKCAHGP